MNITSWGADSSDSNNKKNLVAIQQWWIDLDDKSVTLTPETTTLLSNVMDGSDVMSKSPKTFTIKNPQMQDNKLTWGEPDCGTEWNIAAQKLYLDRSKKQLTIISQEQPARHLSFTVNALE